MRSWAVVVRWEMRSLYMSFGVKRTSFRVSAKSASSHLIRLIAIQRCCAVLGSMEPEVAIAGHIRIAEQDVKTR